MFSERINSMSTGSFMFVFLFVVFTIGMGVPIILDSITKYDKRPVKVIIIKNCCDTGYCIKTLDEKVIQKISTSDGLKLDTINYSFEQISEYDVFGSLIDKKIIWKRKYIVK